MRFPRQAIRSAGIYHLPTTGGSSQAYPSTPDVNLDVAFLPLDRKDHVMEGGDLSVAWEMYAEASADVRVTDKAVIGGVNYYVKFIFDAQVGGLAHRRCTLSTQN